MRLPRISRWTFVQLSQSQQYLPSHLKPTTQFLQRKEKGEISNKCLQKLRLVFLVSTEWWRKVNKWFEQTRPRSAPLGQHTSNTQVRLLSRVLVPAHLSGQSYNVTLAMHYGLTRGWVQKFKASYLAYFLQCALTDYASGKSWWSHCPLALNTNALWWKHSRYEAETRQDSPPGESGARVLLKLQQLSR